jgi:hypothetical protein
MSGGASARRGLIRQGDLLLVPLNQVPEYKRRVRTGRLVLAEGEATGHAHVIDDERASVYSAWDNFGGPLSPFLHIEGDEPVLLVHEEHDVLSVPPGVYEVRRQREYAPRQLVRWVSD